MRFGRTPRKGPWFWRMCPKQRSNVDDTRCVSIYGNHMLHTQWWWNMVLTKTMFEISRCLYSFYFIFEPMLARERCVNAACHCKRSWASQNFFGGVLQQKSWSMSCMGWLRYAYLAIAGSCVCVCGHSAHFVLASKVQTSEPEHVW